VSENDSHFRKLREPLLGFARSNRMSEREVQLERENGQLRETLAEFRDLVAELRQQLEQQATHIDRLVKMTFGRKSERHVGPSLFDGLEGPGEEAAAPEPQNEPEIPAPTTTRHRHGRRRPPANLDVERVELDLSDAEKICPCCSTIRVRCGTSEPSRRYDYRPAKLFIRETTRVSYVCRTCEQGGFDPQFTRAALPPEPIPRSSAAPGLLAQIIVAKFVDHLPLYRQESIFERDGFVIPRSTQCEWLQECARLLDPLYRAMIVRMRQSFAIHADDSPVTLLAPLRTAYAWVYLGDDAQPFTLFDFQPGRDQQRPAQFLLDFPGWIHSDGYAGYNLVHGGDRHVGCWIHVRRKFYEARDRDVRAVEALGRIRRLYAIEREAKDQKLMGESLAVYRQEHAKPVLDQFSAWLMDHRSGVLPASALGEAFTYAINQWPSLVRYLADHRLDLDNGSAERAIRPLAIGRKNWLFVGGDGGLRTASVLMSVVASAKRSSRHPWEYLRDVLTRMSARPPNTDVSDLLPDVWKPTSP
jgi:transposase